MKGSKPVESSRQLHVGSRVRLSGGYDMEPRWLSGRAEHFGECVSFIEGENGKDAAVVRLEQPLTFENAQGSYVALRLRYAGAVWGEAETVHLELFQEAPKSLARGNPRGIWIESHASYQVEGPNNSSKPTPLRGSA